MLFEVMDWFLLCVCLSFTGTGSQIALCWWARTGDSGPGRRSLRSPRWAAGSPCQLLQRMVSPQSAPWELAFSCKHRSRGACITPCLLSITRYALSVVQARQGNSRRSKILLSALWKHRVNLKAFFLKGTKKKKKWLMGANSPFYN